MVLAMEVNANPTEGCMTNCTFNFLRFLLVSSDEREMRMDKDKAEAKAAILAAISEEVALWLDKEGGIKDGYEYNEEEFMKTAHNVSRILLTGSLGKAPKGRNGKKNPHLLRETRSRQVAPPVP